MKRSRNWPASTSAWPCSTSRRCSIVSTSDPTSARFPPNEPRSSGRESAHYSPAGKVRADSRRLLRLKGSVREVALAGILSVKAFRIQFGSAVRAKAGTDPGVGVFLNVELHPAPKAFGAQNSLAGNTNGQKPVESLHLGQRRLQLLNQPLSFFRRLLALVQQASLPLQPAHRQGQSAKPIFQ